MTRRLRGGQESRALDSAFGALADSTRRGIVRRLTRGECSVTKLAEPFTMSAPAISKHLRVLEAAGLIVRRKDGRVHYCRLRAEPLRHAGNWIQEQRLFWEQQFDALGAFLEREDL
ncbi:MAG TPA: metalloregulator ArsR/SmtB family transcription factor [Bryobacteraceae bacterium]|nr:metalloregulator ArsR/SmtB family transcription factor [Bryobacteraceae bacterium]